MLSIYHQIHRSTFQQNSRPIFRDISNPHTKPRLAKFILLKYLSRESVNVLLRAKGISSNAMARQILEKKQEPWENNGLGMEKKLLNSPVFFQVFFWKKSSLLNYLTEKNALPILTKPISCICLKRSILKTRPSVLRKWLKLMPNHYSQTGKKDGKLLQPST